MKIFITLILSIFITVYAAENNGNNGDGKDNKNEQTIVIHAKHGRNTQGTSLGVIEAGKTITFQYLSGRWTAWPRSKPKNPDEKGNNEDLNCPPPTICLRANGVNTALGEIGLESSTKPWSMTVQTTGEIILNMNYDEKFENNVGAVVYKVTIR